MNAAPFILLALAFGATWLPAAAEVFPLPIWVVIGAGAVAVAGFAGQTSLVGVVLLGLLAGACGAWLRFGGSAGLSGGGRRVAALSVCGALALGIGFAGPGVFPPVHIGPSGGSFGKAAAGLFLFAAVAKRFDRPRGGGRAALFGMFFGIGVTGILGAIAAGIGYLRWSPHGGPLAAIEFAIGNAVFAVLPEEAFFRGLIQAPMEERFSRGSARAVPVLVSAGAFGLVHFGAGVTFVVLATMAGVANALVYSLTRRIEAPVLCHLTLNALRVVLFQ